jgi:hypothetical protein
MRGTCVVKTVTASACAPCYGTSLVFFSGQVTKRKGTPNCK